MANTDLLDGIAVFASSYVKRYLETHYDELMRTAPARKLMEQGAATRYGVEAALYALVAYADQRWSPHTPLRRLVREVALNAPTEISSRLINGFRDEVVRPPGPESSSEARSVEQSLLRLDDETLGPLLIWLAQTTPEDRARFRAIIPTLSDDELQKIAGLTPQDLEALLKISIKQSGESPLCQDLTQAVRGLRTRLRSRLQGGNQRGANE